MKSWNEQRPELSAMTIGYPDSTELAIVISGRSIDIHIKHGDAGSNGEETSSQRSRRTRLKVNLWKDIPAGDKPPELLNMIIEVMSGSRDKYEYDLKLKTFVLDRIIPSSVVFPVEYGFVPQTWFDDNDPLDIMALSYEPLEVGCMAKVRVVGALIIEDEEGLDAKILSVLVNDARFEGYNDITDIHAHQLKEIQEFFETYKRLEPHKWAIAREWKNAREAKQIVDYAMEKYRELSSK